MSDDDDACEQTIEVFCRIRPSRRPSRMYAIAGEEQSSVTFTVPHDQSAGYINNQRETFQFPFAYVFDQDTKQDQVFDRIAAKVVNNVIAGYNGTIFAYGQTGSGKTFTITGGAEHYDDRGLIPRSISYLFDYIDRHRHEAAFTVLVSYLEIYNNCGYDLLAPDHDSKRLEDLPKITWTDDADDNDGELRLSRLKRYPATSTEEALNLLFVGDTNRVICETPMNDASSRSHCIFMLTLESRSSSTDMMRRSRLNLVDLAGSERVAKTQVSGRILVEARAINLSLHYLEQCIVALHEKAQGKRVHVPYRNSMITWVLKDSLGGNCKTVMIANISVDLPNIVESISTCRFAQRVAMIVNRATINEQVDPALVIERLKRRVQELQQQLAERCSCQNESQQQQSEVLSDESRVMIESRIVSFLNADDDMESNSLALMSRPRISYGFTHLKSLYRIRPEKLTENSDLHNLKTMVESRDSEIAILVNMLKERGMPQRPAITKHVENVGNVLQTAGLQLAPDQQDDLIERDRALQLFRQGHPLNAKIQKGIEELRVKFAEAKALGETVAGLMKEIDQTKAVLQQRRMAQAVKQISDSNRDCTDEGNEISTLCEKMMSDKSRYADAVSSLKKLKLEIEHTQRFLSNSRGKLQSEFDRQWENRENNRLDHTRHIGDSIEDSKIDADIRAFYEMSKQVKRNTVI